jgi:dipeptidyl aminopeptidase/acylaminoacyl peptidase
LNAHNNVLIIIKIKNLDLKEFSMRNIIFGLLLVTATGLSAQEKRAITFEDLYGYPQVENISLSPDGKYLVAEVVDYNLDTDERFHNIWLVPTHEGVPEQFTSSGMDYAPIWSPKGNLIAFESERPSTADGDTTNQIWVISPDGGEAEQLTDIYTEIADPVWSSDGKYMLFTSEVYPDCNDDDCNRMKDEAKDENPVKAKLYNKLLFRHVKWWEDGKRNHIFLLDLEAGEHEDLTPFDKDAPPIAGAASPGYAFSQDGSEIAFVMNTDTVVAISTNNDIFTLNLDTNRLTRISTSPGGDDYPLYSPSGRQIAYRSMARAGYESDKRNLILYDRIGKTYENLTESFNRSVGEFTWGPYSKYIYFAAVDAGLNKIFRLNVRNKEIKALVADGVCCDINVSSNGIYLYYLKSTTTQPYEIYQYNSKNNKQTRLTSFGDTLFSQLDLAPAKDFWFMGARGDSIHGMMTLPPQFDPGTRHPLVLLIHGGPQYAWLKDFNYYGWNTQLMAAQGYIVVQIDPHGSRGYGQPFVDAINNDWGGAPYEDLMMGLDYLISKHDYIDTTKMAALGRSYGGYMTNWICGQTDRFACLVTVDGPFENISDYYSTEELWFPNWEFGGPPWKNMENYTRQSPAEYVQNFKTPTLVIHGQLDYRVDVSQGIMMYTALQTRNVPSQFLYFPDEGHMLRKLHNIAYAYEIQLEWLAKYLK